MGRKVAYSVAVVVLLGAIAFAALDVWPWPRLNDQRRLPSAPRGWIASDTLHAGESLGDVFGRHGIGAQVLADLVGRLKFDPRRLKAGLVFRFGHRDSAVTADSVTIRTAPDEETRLLRSDDRWLAERRSIQWASHPVRVEGQVAGVPGCDRRGAGQAHQLLIAKDMADQFVAGRDAVQRGFPVVGRDATISDGDQFVTG